MKKQIEEMLELQKKDVDFLMREIFWEGFNMEMDLAFEDYEPFWESLNRRQMIFEVVATKSLNERIEYYNSTKRLLTYAIKVQNIELGKSLWQDLNLFKHCFLPEINPEDYLYHNQENS